VKFITEKMRELNLKTHLTFIHYEKTSDKVKRNIILKKNYAKLSATDYNKCVKIYNRFSKYKSRSMIWMPSVNNI
jgi:hypothetical protein